MKTKPIVLLFIVLLIAFAIPLTTHQTRTVRADDLPADIRVLHALTGVAEADFYLNDIFAGTLAYGNAADYILVPPGDITLRAYAPGTDPSGTPLFETTFQAASDEHETITVMGSADAMSFGAFATDRSPLPFGQSRINLVHAVQGGDAIAIDATATDESIIKLSDSLAFGASAINDVPAGTYLLNAAGALSNAVVTLHAGTTYTVVIVGNADGSSPIELRVFSAATTLDGPAGYIRSVHAIPDGPAVHLYLNDTLVASHLDYGESTTYIAVAPGTYEAAFYAAGTGPGNGTPIISNTLEVEDTVSLTNVAAGNIDAPLPTLYVDTRTAPAEDQAGRLWVCNTTANPIELQMDGVIAIPDIVAYELSEGIDLSEGVHSLAILSAGAVHDTLEDISVHPNTAVNLRTLVVTSGETIVLRARPLVSEHTH